MQLGKYRKFIVAIIGALVAGFTLYFDSTPEWLQALIPVLSALGVYQVPND
jgi:hypothetical protein